MGLELPPAGAKRLRDGVAERFQAAGGWGRDAIPPATDPGKPNRPGPGRQGRTSSRALHLVTLALAPSTKCGSAADGMAQSGVRWWSLLWFVFQVKKVIDRHLLYTRHCSQASAYLVRLADLGNDLSVVEPVHTAITL